MFPVCGSSELHPNVFVNRSVDFAALNFMRLENLDSSVNNEGRVSFFGELARAASQVARSRWRVGCGKAHERRTQTRVNAARGEEMRRSEHNVFF